MKKTNNAGSSELNLTSKKRLLNVGGNSKVISVAKFFDGWQHDLLDIDPDVKPDILCDARQLYKLPPRQYDAVYCSHNLEHYQRHELPQVLSGFRTILKKDGFVFAKVPDVMEVMKVVVENKLDIDDVLYTSPAGPILVRDVIYGYHVEIERSGNDFFAHKTGFSRQSIEKVFKENGFNTVYSACQMLEIRILAFMEKPSVTPNFVEFD